MVFNMDKIIVDNRNSNLINKDYLNLLNYIKLLSYLKNNNYITEEVYKKSIVQIQKKHI